MNKKCPITNDDVIDDCHIRIEFGYGSDLDMTTYSFSPVRDEVGSNMIDEDFDFQEWSQEDKRNHGLED